MRTPSGLLLLLPLLLLTVSQVEGAYPYVNLCDDYSANCCFNGGVNETEYFVTENSNDPNQLEVDCLIDSSTSR